MKCAHEVLETLEDPDRCCFLQSSVPDSSPRMSTTMLAASGPIRPPERSSVHLLLWTMVPITVALIVVQEMTARMGAVTGKGLSDFIREEFGLRVTFFMMIGILVTNFGNVVAEFAGIAGSLELFGVSKYISVPICAVIVWLIIVKGQYKSVEKVFLAASFFYITYIVAGVLAKPAWMDAIVSTVTPPPRAAWSQNGYVYMVIGLVGTTIAPWMQFYLQASIVEKGVTKRDLKASRIDVIAGCIFTDLVAWFILVACAATLYAHGYRNVSDAKEPRKRSVRWLDSTLTSCLRSDYSTRLSLRRRSCRYPRRTRCVKAWDSNLALARSLPRRQYFTGSTPHSFWPAPASS